MLWQALVEGWSESLDETLTEVDWLVERCFELDPVSGACNTLVGFASTVTGRREEGLRAWERALELTDLPAWHAWYSAALALAGRSEEALEQIAFAKESSPNDPALPDWLNFESRAHFAVEDYEKARAAALESIRLNSNGPYNNLANSYQFVAASCAHIGDTVAARSALEKALELRPDLSLEHMALIYSTADPEHGQRYLDGLRMAGLEE